MSHVALTDKERAALKVVDLAKAQALADNHFLSAAVGRLRVEMCQLARPLAIDDHAPWHVWATPEDGDSASDDGAFENLGGLIYSTDGWGTYPEWVPDYKTAFVFYDDNYRPECVPTWAAQIVLDENAINGNKFL